MKFRDEGSGDEVMLKNVGKEICRGNCHDMNCHGCKSREQDEEPKQQYRRRLRAMSDRELIEHIDGESDRKDDERDFREAIIEYIDMRFMCTKEPHQCKECKEFGKEMRRRFA